MDNERKVSPRCEFCGESKDASSARILSHTLGSHRHVSWQGSCASSIRRARSHRDIHLKILSAPRLSLRRDLVEMVMGGSSSLPPEIG